MWGSRNELGVPRTDTQVKRLADALESFSDPSLEDARAAIGAHRNRLKAVTPEGLGERSILTGHPETCIAALTK